MAKLNKFSKRSQYVVSLDSHNILDVFLRSSLKEGFEAYIEGMFSRQISSSVTVFEDFQTAFQFNAVTQEVFNQGNVQSIKIYEVLIETTSDTELTPSDLKLYWSFTNPKLEDLEKNLGIKIKRETIR
ncbi:hypothetical protein FDH01_gp191 [Acinetobacter phage vB_AbaM_ME3]|uniref:Uncharacterized protein n=1 Tax=Acinetobacter phage vB_AbaM_ME3 TaxID=1837876 RepID=A0A172Q0P8_9CAUD|nr:hypothetical protein FDH01_gp191 [Acinetobacter phage vB_AbaM_ME3]AND75431.1 hypothetical protein ME3_270 [Acinetobacter phage vB_AbaM_ME3]